MLSAGGEDRWAWTRTPSRRFQISVVLDSKMKHRQSEDQTSREKYPSRDEQVHVRNFQPIGSPGNGPSGALYGFVEASEVGELGRIVRHSSHHPVNGCLPHRVQEPTEDVKPDTSRVAFIVYIDMLEILCLCLFACIVLLIEVCPDVNDKDHDREYPPPKECSHTTTHVL